MGTVTSNLELANTEPSFLEKIQGSFLQDFNHIFVDQLIRNLILCVSLLKDISCDILTASSTITHILTKLKYTFFSIRHIAASLFLETLDSSTSMPHLGSHFK